MRVALTGHRPQRLGLPDDELNIQWIKIGHWIFNQILNLIMYQIFIVVWQMALIF